MIRRLRHRGGPTGRIRRSRTTAPRVEAVESRLVLSSLGAPVSPSQPPGSWNDRPDLHRDVAVAAQEEATADLVLTIDTVPPGLLEVGQTVFYSVTVVNNGALAADDVTLVNTLPAGAEFVATTAGTFDPDAGTVTVGAGTLAEGATLQVWIAVRPLQAGNLVNQAFVTTTTSQPDKDTNVAFTFDQVVAPVVPPPPPVNLAPPPPQVVSVERIGIGFHGMPMSYAVRFSEPMDPDVVQEVGRYLLEAPEPGGRLDGVRDVPIPIAMLRYDANTNTVLIVPGRRIPLRDPVRLSIDGDMAGVFSAAGILIDGNDDGRPGGNFVTILQGFTTRPPRPLPPWAFAGTHRRF